MKIVDLLGGKAEYYLNHTCKTIDKQLIHIPGPDMDGWSCFFIACQDVKFASLLR